MKHELEQFKEILSECKSYSNDFVKLANKAMMLVYLLDETIIGDDFLELAIKFNNLGINTNRLFQKLSDDLKEKTENMVK